MDSLLWWLALFLVGVPALPITAVLFNGLSDHGYAFSRAVGLGLIGYVFWVLGLAGVVSNTRGGVLIAVGVVGAASAAILALRRRAILGALGERWRLFLATEALFALLFAAWLGIRAHTPAIAHTEQPMDFMVLNSILRSPDFPPRDGWFAGQSLSYYYFGYFMAAFLTKLTGTPSAVTYNLMLASTAAMAGTGVASIVFNVAKAMGRRLRRRSNVAPLAAGVLAAALLLFASNLEGAVEYLRANRIGSEGSYEWIDVRGLDLDMTAENRYPNAQQYPNVTPRDCVDCPGWFPTDTWWWFRASRVINTFRDGNEIDPTITEFPFFSLLLGDLHPHVMSPPFVALALGLGLGILLGRRRPQVRWLWKRPGFLLLLALLLGSLGFVNTWDLPVFLGLFLAALGLRACATGRRSLPGLALDIAVPAAVIALGAVLLYLPFYVHLHSNVDGVSYLRRIMTRPVHFALVWGPLALLNLVLLGGLAWEVLRRPSVITARSRPRLDLAEPPVPAGGIPTVAGGAPDAVEGSARRSWVPTIAVAAALALLPFTVWAALELRAGVTGSRELLPRGTEAGVGSSLAAVGSRFAHLLPLLLVVGVAVALLLRLGRWSGPRSAATRFALLVVLWGFLLTAGMELFRVAEGGGENRMNTVFKLSYQAWVLFSVGGAIGVYWLVTRVGGGAHTWGRKLAIGGGLAVLLVPVFVYAPAALYDKSDHFAGPPTLDGLADAARADPLVLEAALWLRDHAPPDAVIAEGVSWSQRGRPGGDFRPDVGRISQWSGVPTVLGWPYHEWLWRGDWEGINARFQDVEVIYRNNSLARVRQAMERYRVQYVVVGPLERWLYGKRVGERLGGFMDVAFRNAQVTVYTLR